MTKTFLVTGGYGFIGSNFIRLCLQKKNIKIINVDALLTGSNLHNLEGTSSKNYHFVKGNICNINLMEKLIKKVDYVINFAAESHVDRSISNSKPFINSNILGVHTILEILRKFPTVKFLQISTDEVYGEILKGKCDEHAELNPSNPYSASKASAEMLIRSYARTYNLHAVIIRCTNNFGPRQFPEKLIPKTIICALKNERIPIHGKGIAKRQWIHVNDHCAALLKILTHWKSSAIYNISGNFEETNLGIVHRILNLMNKSIELITFVEDRPGQDRRYAINDKLIQKQLGFKSKISPSRALSETIAWYMSNPEWWKKIPFNRIKNPTPWKK